VSSIYIYRAQDFDFVIEQINTTAWQSFWFVLNEHLARNNALRSLHKTPAVLAALNKVREERGEAPIAAPA
jgi:hypothetical protein